MKTLIGIAASLVLLPLSGHGQLELRDDLGRSVVLPSTAHKIVSLAPSITETLFAIGAGEQVCGVTDYCNHPPEARNRQSIGGIIAPNIEVIISLRPDLIIVTPEGNAQESFRQVRAIGVPVFVTNPRDVEGVRKSILDLGVLTGKSAQALALTGAMKRSEDSLRSLPTGKVPLLLIISLQPLMVAGSGTFLSEMIDLAGGLNLAAGTGLTYPAFSREQVVASDPEVILMPADLTGIHDVLSFYPEWEEVGAVRSGRVYEVDPDIISRPGPRVIEGAIRIRNLLFGRSATE
jgi:iron complex transport system substrate-binding protein